MRKGLVFLVAFFAALNIQAASQNILWGEPHSSARLPPIQNKHAKGMIPLYHAQSDYQLQPAEPNARNQNHQRYQLTYKGLPVWGYQLLYHKQKNAKATVTGIQVSGIEKDVTTMRATLSAPEAQTMLLKKLSKPVKFKTIKKIIYLDDQNKAHLAYHAAFYQSDDQQILKAPNFIVDAHDGRILKNWDAIHRNRVGQGLGGNAFQLPYRPGMYQYGSALPNLPSLGKFDVRIDKGLCYLENDSVKVINFMNMPLGLEHFPILASDEQTHQLEAFSYPCGLETGFINYADGASGPINYAFSPSNDTIYFAQKTIEMYKEIYGVEKPLGEDLPLRAFTHLGLLDIAFAMPTLVENGQLIAHQQIIIGNGDTLLTAPSQSIVGHELSHNFTLLNSGLIYDRQSGAINEAFSDMAGIALQDYIRRDYPWYWDGEDWSFGREAMLTSQPIRYLDDPTKDGESISHAAEYHDKMDVHNASGVFNKAFYLLAHKPGWNLQMAFQVMVDANRNYWSPIAYYDFAACGVIQATIDRDTDPTPVIEAFQAVGVSCPSFSRESNENSM